MPFKTTKLEEKVLERSEGVHYGSFFLDITLTLERDMINIAEETDINKRMSRRDRDSSCEKGSGSKNSSPKRSGKNGKNDGHKDSNRRSETIRRDRKDESGPSQSKKLMEEEILNLLNLSVDLRGISGPQNIKNLSENDVLPLHLSPSNNSDIALEKNVSKSKENQKQTIYDTKNLSLNDKIVVPTSNFFPLSKSEIVFLKEISESNKLEKQKVTDGQISDPLNPAFKKVRTYVKNRSKSANASDMSEDRKFPNLKRKNTHKCYSNLSLLIHDSEFALYSMSIFKSNSEKNTFELKPKKGLTNLRELFKVKKPEDLGSLVKINSKNNCLSNSCDSIVVLFPVKDERNQSTSIQRNSPIRSKSTGDIVCDFQAVDNSCEKNSKLEKMFVTKSLYNITTSLKTSNSNTYKVLCYQATTSSYEHVIKFNTFYEEKSIQELFYSNDRVEKLCLGLPNKSGQNFSARNPAVEQKGKHSRSFKSGLFQRIKNLKRRIVDKSSKSLRAVLRR